MTNDEFKKDNAKSNINETDESEIYIESNSTLESFKEWYRKHQVHPATIHFPIALHFFAAFWDILFFFNQTETFEFITYYSFLVATIMGAVAFFTGILSWWINYNLIRSKILMIKLYLTIITLLLGVLGVFLHSVDTNVAYQLSIESLIYHFTILITVPTVIILAHYGGKLAWGSKIKANKLKRR